MSGARSDPGPDERVRRYYRTVSRYIDREHVQEGEEAFWRRMSEGAGEAGVLDLGCGTGRITVALARGARFVVGVDLVPAMLERARRRLADRPGVHLVRGDMRRLPFSGAFGMVAAASDPFTHMIRDVDRDRSLAEAARLLAPGGRLVAELHWFGPGRLAAARSENGYHRTRTLEGPGAELRIRETWRCHDETRRCEARYEYLRGGRLLDEASFRARLWSLAELRERLGRAGLSVRSLWSDFEETPFDPAASSRLVVVADAGGPAP